MEDHAPNMSDAQIVAGLARLDAMAAHDPDRLVMIVMASVFARERLSEQQLESYRALGARARALIGGSNGAA